MPFTFGEPQVGNEEGSTPDSSPFDHSAGLQANLSRTTTRQHTRRNFKLTYVSFLFTSLKVGKGLPMAWNGFPCHPMVPWTCQGTWKEGRTTGRNEEGGGLAGLPEGL